MSESDQYRRYRHIDSGAVYRIIHIANQSATRPDWPLIAVYEDSDGRIWARPLAIFLERCEVIM